MYESHGYHDYSRLAKMLVYTNEAEGIYALSRVPIRRLEWGSTELTIMRLCTPRTNKPITVWVVGSIASLWFFDPREGELNEKVSIGVKPLTNHAMNVGKRILERLSQPASGEDFCVSPVLLPSFLIDHFTY